MHKLKTVLRWIFNTFCLLTVSLLFLVGAWKARNLNVLWLLIPIALWILAFKRKTANWLALGFLACIVGIVIWLFLPDRGTWRPYNFDYELKDLEAKRAVPDSENAAIAYQKIFARIDVNDAPPFFDCDDSNGPSTFVFWKGSEHPETAAFIDARIDIITDAMAASRMEKCVFPLQTNPLNFSIDTLHGMRQLPYLLRSAANRDMGEGRIDDALEKYFSIIFMGRQIKQHSTTIFFMSGMAFEDLGISKLPYIIIESNSTPEQRKAIGSVFKTGDDWTEFAPAMSQCEKVFGENIFGIFYETNDKGSIRYIRKNPVPESFIKEYNCPPTVFNKQMYKLAPIALWFVLPSDPRVIDTEYAKAFDEAAATADPNQWNIMDMMQFNPLTAIVTRSGVRFCAKVQANFFAQVRQGYNRSIIRYRTMHILLALREYKDANGHWPETLDQIKDKVPAETMIDPFTGGSFIYKVKSNKFLLYSVGPNKIDEKCLPQPKTDFTDLQTLNKELKQFDDILIWPQKYEQAKEFFDANTGN